MESSEIAALEHLYAVAKPSHIPGAWIRDAIDRIRESAITDGRDARMARTDYIEWPIDSLLDHLCELATEARGQVFDTGSVQSATARRIMAVRTEILTRARTVRFLTMEGDSA